jgi:hypothetical protein
MPFLSRLQLGYINAKRNEVVGRREWEQHTMVYNVKRVFYLCASTLIVTDPDGFSTKNDYIPFLKKMNQKILDAFLFFVLTVVEVEIYKLHITLESWNNLKI